MCANVVVDEKYLNATGVFICRQPYRRALRNIDHLMNGVCLLLLLTYDEYRNILGICFIDDLVLQALCLMIALARFRHDAEARETLELLVNWCDLCLPANEQAFAEAHRIKIQHFQVIARPPMDDSFASAARKNRTRSWSILDAQSAC